MITLQHLYHQFPTQYSCRQLINQLLWPEGITCPVCSQTLIHWYPNRNCFYCNRCRQCCHHAPNTIFYRTKIPLQKWFWIVLYLGYKQTLSTRQISRLINLDKSTVTRMFARIDRINDPLIELLQDKLNYMLSKING
jgi:transposase-like protein